jgi:hypothetical protein
MKRQRFHEWKWTPSKSDPIYIGPIDHHLSAIVFRRRKDIKGDWRGTVVGYWSRRRQCIVVVPPDKFAPTTRRTRGAAPGASIRRVK